MTRECQVRICERLGVRLPGPTRHLVRMLVGRYAAGDRRALQGKLTAAAPIEYPEVGLYHPRLPNRVFERLDQLPKAGLSGTVGLLLLRSYLISGNAAHYDGVIEALEARGLCVVPRGYAREALG